MLTVSFVCPVMDWNVALTVLTPATIAVASPVVPILATFAFDEAHVANPVRSCWLLSLKVPVAVNCCDVPAAILGLAGLTASAVNIAEVMVSRAVPLIEPTVAVTVA